MKTIVCLSTISLLVVGIEMNAQNPGAYSVNGELFMLKPEALKVCEGLKDSACNYSVAEKKNKIQELKRMRAAIDSQIVDFFERTETVRPSGITQAEFISKQISGSEFCGKLSNQLYERNKEAIKFLLHAGNDLSVLMNENILDLLRKSTKAITSSRALRKEAIEEQSLSARLAVMINAEEKEFLALKYQEEVLALLLVVSDQQLLAGE